MKQRPLWGAKNTELLSDLKKAKESIKKFDGIDPENFKNMMSAFEDNQDLKDISEGKYEEVINRRMEKERVKFTSETTALTEKSATFESENSDLRSEVSKLMIDNNVVAEFIKEKGLESGIQDITLRAKTVFKIEGKELIGRDANGEIIAGKSGPITITEWIGNQKEVAPHLFQGSKGSGATGGEGGQGGSALIDKIQAAAASGDQTEYRRLRQLQKSGKTE